MDRCMLLMISLWFVSTSKTIFSEPVQEQTAGDCGFANVRMYTFQPYELNYV